MWPFKEKVQFYLPKTVCSNKPSTFTDAHLYFTCWRDSRYLRTLKYSEKATAACVNLYEDIKYYNTLGTQVSIVSLPDLTEWFHYNGFKCNNQI